MPIKLCVNCKKHIAKGVAVIGEATTRVNDICKKAVNEIAIQDFVTGEKTIPNLDAVQLYSFEAAGAILGVWDEIGIVAGKTAAADEYMAVRYCGNTRWVKLYNTPA